MKLPSLVNDLSDVMRNLGEVADSLRTVEAKNLTDADRMALRAVLEELNVLVRIGNSFEQTTS